MNENQAGKDKGPISQEEIEEIKARLAAFKQAQKELRVARASLSKRERKVIDYLTRIPRKKNDEHA